MLPNSSSPSAFASRLAGSTVSTSTLPPMVAWRPSRRAAAAVVVLPTPPEPQEMTISFAASNCSSDRAGSVGVAPSFGGHQYPSSSPSGSATWRVARTPCVR